MTRRITLSVNDVPVEIDYFVQGFIDHTVGGMASALERTGEIKHLVVSLEGEKIAMILNDTVVPINRFANDIIRNTIIGMVSSLKEVNEINKLTITIGR
jgi:sulfur carrier protein ThiS